MIAILKPKKRENLNRQNRHLKIQMKIPTHQSDRDHRFEDRNPDLVQDPDLDPVPDPDLVHLLQDLKVVLRPEVKNPEVEVIQIKNL